MLSHLAYLCGIDFFFLLFFVRFLTFAIIVVFGLFLFFVFFVLLFAFIYYYSLYYGVNHNDLLRSSLDIAMCTIAI